MLLGPADVGLVGLMTNFVLAVSTLVSAGMGLAGTRQIAAAYSNGDPIVTEQKRKALYALTAIFSCSRSDRLVVWARWYSTRSAW